MQLRFELYTLQLAFRKDVDDPERIGIADAHLGFYYTKYFKKTLTPKHFGVATNIELTRLVKDRPVRAPGACSTGWVCLEGRLPARCREWGSSSAGAKLDQPEFRPEVGARVSEFEDMLFCSAPLLAAKAEMGGPATISPIGSGPRTSTSRPKSSPETECRPSRSVDRTFPGEFPVHQASGRP